MARYLLTLFVTVEEETCIRNLFIDKGWDYPKQTGALIEQGVSLEGQWSDQNDRTQWVAEGSETVLPQSYSQQVDDLQRRDEICEDKSLSQIGKVIDPGILEGTLNSINTAIPSSSPFLPAAMKNGIHDNETESANEAMGVLKDSLIIKVSSELARQNLGPHTEYGKQLIQEQGNYECLDNQEAARLKTVDCNIHQSGAGDSDDENEGENDNSGGNNGNSVIDNRDLDVDSTETEHGKHNPDNNLFTQADSPKITSLKDSAGTDKDPSNISNEHGTTALKVRPKSHKRQYKKNTQRRLRSPVSRKARSKSKGKSKSSMKSKSNDLKKFKQKQTDRVPQEENKQSYQKEFKGSSCSFCHKVFRDNRACNIHERSHAGIKPLKCEKCKKTFSEPSTLKRHLKTHEERIPLSCCVCEDTFSMEAEFKKHVEERHPNENVSIILSQGCVCKECGNRFAKPDHLKKHISSLHKKTLSKLHVCNICGKYFTRIARLNSHIVSHSNTKEGNQEGEDLKTLVQLKLVKDPVFSCRICEEKFVLKLDLKRHIEEFHLNEDVDKVMSECCACAECGNRFADFDVLEQHVTNLHPWKSSQRHVCSVCRKSYANVGRLNTHLLSHLNSEQKDMEGPGLNGEQIEEDDGNEETESEEDGKDYQESMTGTEDRYFMKDESRKIKNMHRQRKGDVTLIKSEGSVANWKRSKKRNSFTCVKCNENFVDANGLRRHMKRHEGDVPYSCFICKNVFHTESSLKNHAEHHHQDSVENILDQAFPCEQCSSRFAKIKFLKIHKGNYHQKKSDKSYVCRVCGKAFLQAYSLNAHMRNRCVGGRVLQEGLGSAYSEQKNLEDNSNNVNWKDFLVHPSVNLDHGVEGTSGAELVHENVTAGLCREDGPVDMETEEADGSEDTLKCSDCEQTFPTRFLLRKHQFKDHRTGLPQAIGTHVCKVCGLSFVHPLKFRQHLRQHNPDLELRLNLPSGDKFVCKLCGKIYSRFCYLKKHQTLAHTKRRPSSPTRKLLCQICAKSFSRKHNLRMHMRRHLGETRFSCENCDKAFLTQYSLRRHQVRKHSTEKPFKCAICTEAYKEATLLHRHMEMVHFGLELSTKLKQSHLCDQCGASFTTNTSLLRHKTRLHADVPTELPRIYKCPQCEKMFNRPAHVTLHLRVHTGERPYQCFQCGKTFSSSSCLKRHGITHMEGKPFKCMICSKGFSRKNLVEGHLVKKHGVVNTEAANYITSVQ